MYRIGRGEEGVLSTPPYTQAILPSWRFRTPAEARRSAAAILRLYRGYLDRGDFAGMDMCRKFLQMGYTRSMRYARHRGGRKYGPDGVELPLDPDPEKLASAKVFRAAWDKVRADPRYQDLKAIHMARARAERSSTANQGPKAATGARRTSSSVHPARRARRTPGESGAAGKAERGVLRHSRKKNV